MKNLMVFSLRPVFGLFLFMTAFVISMNANVAMPGFFNAGGGQEFVLMYPQDSVHLDKVQMKEELILINLYPGFAVVRGDYYMHNHSDSIVSLHTGYPANSIYPHDRKSDWSGEYYELDFSNMHKLEVSVNGNPVSWEKQSITDPSGYGDESYIWYVWNMDFAPQTVTHIRVYFVVNTNYALVREGYNSAHVNGFVYLLESGKPWAGNIEKGRICVSLKDDLTAKSIGGILPESAYTLFAESGQLVYDFAGLEPEHTDNVLIRYGKKIEGFDEKSLPADPGSYYRELDAVDAASLNKAEGVSFAAGDPFHAGGAGGFLVGAIFFLTIFGLPLLLVVVVVTGIVIFVRRRRKRQQS
jgi:hypothetical protein